MQKETRRLLQKQQDTERAAGGSGDNLDPERGFTLPPEARAQHPTTVTAPPKRAKSERRGAVSGEGVDPSLAHLDLNDLAALPTDVRLLTREDLARLEAEAALASSPLEAEEAAAAQGVVDRASTDLGRRELHHLKSENRDAHAAATGQPEFGEADLALQDTVIDAVLAASPSQSEIETSPEPGTVPASSSMASFVAKAKAAPVEQQDLFAAAHLERRAAEKGRPKPTARQKREELIENLLDPTISLEEAATILNVCKTTVRRYTNRGLLECVRTPGNQRRFKLSTILGFVEEKDVKGIGKRGRKPTKSRVALDAETLDAGK